MPGFSNCRCAKFPAPAPLFYGKFRRDRQQKGPDARASGLRLRKSIKSVAVGGHAPTTATPTGKFCGKLCARNEVTSARFAAKFCRRLRSRAPPAADAARRSRGSGRRMQAPSKARRMMRAPQPGHSKGGNSRGRRTVRGCCLLCSVSSFSTRWGPDAGRPGLWVVFFRCADTRCSATPGCGRWTRGCRSCGRRCAAAAPRAG